MVSLQVKAKEILEQNILKPLYTLVIFSEGINYNHLN